MPAVEPIRRSDTSLARHDSRGTIDATLLGLLALSTLAALAGGASLWFDFAALQPWGLCWNDSADQPLALWVRLLWPAAVALAPLSYRSGFFGVCLYCFVNLSIQGSEPAARSLLVDGALDWTIGLISLGYVLGHPSGSVPQRSVLVRHLSLACLVALVLWVGLTWAVRLWQGELGEPRVYRRPILWLHCLAVFWIAAESLAEDTKRVGLVAFLAFCLAWRVAITPDSVWLEGHVASFLVFLLPWTLLAATIGPAGKPAWLGWLWTGFAVVWLASLWTEPSFLADWLEQRWGALAVITVAVVAVAGVWLLPQGVWAPVYFAFASGGILAAVVLIQNRGAALGAAVAMLFAVLFAPLTWRWRGLILGLVVFGVVAVARYEPLAERFRRSLSEGGSGRERLELWRIAWQSSQQHPWLGVGPGQFPHIVQQFNPRLSSRLDAHQSWLEMLAETGWPGLVLFTGFWLLVVATAAGELYAGLSQSGRLADRGPPPPRQVWVARATMAFVAGYVVIGLFGSRHNVPLAYALAALPVSVHLASSPNLLPRKGHG